MNKNYNKPLGIASIVFGLCNLVPVLGETRWYCILCFVALGLPSVVTGFFSLGKTSASALRTQAWIDCLSGCSILFLGLSAFYAASGAMAAFNFVAAFGLIVSGLAGLYVSTRKLNLSLVP